MHWRALASLHGSMRNMASATRAIRAHYRAVSTMLATADPERVYVIPKGDVREVALKWDAFWDAIEQLRIITNDDEFWATGYLTAFAGVLTPRERLSIPGEADSRVYWGSDATPELLMVVDHLRMEIGILQWTDELEDLLKSNLVKTGVPPELLGETIISLKELMAAASPRPS